MTNWNDTSPASAGGCSASGERQEAGRERWRCAGGELAVARVFSDGAGGALSNFPACRLVGKFAGQTGGVG